mgnify:CR=1 FL=1
MLEFIQSRFTLSNVSGSAAAKQMLADAATADEVRSSLLAALGDLAGAAGLGRRFHAEEDVPPRPLEAERAGRVGGVHGRGHEKRGAMPRFSSSRKSSRLYQASFAAYWT